MLSIIHSKPKARALSRPQEPTSALLPPIEGDSFQPLQHKYVEGPVKGFPWFRVGGSGNDSGEHIGRYGVQGLGCGSLNDYMPIMKTNWTRKWQIHANWQGLKVCRNLNTAPYKSRNPKPRTACISFLAYYPVFLPGDSSQISRWESQCPEDLTGVVSLGYRV